MKVLIIKMSSLGDIAHTFPALTDAARTIPNIEFDWVVEENFAALPAMHPQVKRIIPFAFRRLRKKPLKLFFSKEWKAFKKALQTEKYDLVIDAQGLLKSAFITLFARGKKAGLDKNSLWEPLARFAYQMHSTVNPALHAIERMRQLFSKSLGYQFDGEKLNYGIDRHALPISSSSFNDTNYILLLHGTTWATKQWPVAYWQILAKLIAENKTTALIPWGNAEEKTRAEEIAKLCDSAIVLPKMNLAAMIEIVAKAKAIVAVDTGLAHIAAALAVPTVSLYGPTDPRQTGTIGDNQIQLVAAFECAPCLQRVCTYKKQSEQKPACFTTLPPRFVYEKLASLIKSVV